MKSFTVGMIGAALFALVAGRAASLLPCDGGFWEGFRLFYNAGCAIYIFGEARI